MTPIHPVGKNDTPFYGFVTSKELPTPATGLSVIQMTYSEWAINRCGSAVVKMNYVLYKSYNMTKQTIELSNNVQVHYSVRVVEISHEFTSQLYMKLAKDVTTQKE